MSPRAYFENVTHDKSDSLNDGKHNNFDLQIIENLIQQGNHLMKENLPDAEGFCLLRSTDQLHCIDRKSLSE